MADTAPVLLRHGEQFRVPFGVVDRDQIVKLRNLLTDFLLDYPD